MDDETSDEFGTTVTITDEGVVRAWRFEEFRRLGFATASALRLLDSAAELSVARRLVSLGCPHATACAILE